jgi:hypothetical protein
MVTQQNYGRRTIKITRDDQPINELLEGYRMSLRPFFRGRRPLPNDEPRAPEDEDLDGRRDVYIFAPTGR